jgi:trehalose 6-phosphate synthase
MGRRKGSLLTHFIHVPWPGPEDWGLLPERMRRAILTGLCSLDMLGFQTQDDALNFIRTCESLLPEAVVNYRKGRVMLNRNVTHVRDFPISIDVGMLRTASEMDEVRQFRAWFEDRFGDRQIIVRIDRTEPSKNIIRGFQAYDELLENHPEHHGRVQFFAILVPSRLGVNEYQDYLNGIMAAAGSVNAKYGSSEWEPVRVLVGESYPRAVAAMHLYDVLLVNPVADGMNLVAKEGPIVNEKAGVLVLSERAGAHQQLGEHALVISPCDVSATAEALHAALTMDPEERQRRAMALRKIVEREDINYWLCSQFETIEKVVDGRG